MKRKILLLTTAVLLSMASAFAQGGTTGPLSWNLSNGALTISGNGAMPNYEEKGAPWYDYWESIDTVIIVNGVTTIGNYAFHYCFNLYSITIPTSVISIGRSAFYYCEWLHLTTIPNSVTSIGSFAFNGCISLTSITNLNPEPVKILGGEFSDVNITECTLRVPVSAVSVYKKANVWKEFKIEGIEVGIEKFELPNLKIYPNPTTGQLTIDIEQLTITKVEIYDSMGKMQKSRWAEEQKGEFVMDISHLSKGLYFLRIQTETGEVIKKVLKE